MTNAEIIKALRYCVNDEIRECDECPFNKKYRCRDLQATAAADALEAADKRIAELEAKMPKDGARMNHKYCDVVNGCVMCDVELCNGKENRNE